MSRRLLWVLPKWPLPAIDGSRRATVSLVRKLVHLGDTVDLLAIVNPLEPIDLAQARNELGVSRIFVLTQSCRSRAKFKELFCLAKSWLANPRLPLTMRYYSSGALRRSFEGILIQHHFPGQGGYSNGSAAEGAAEPWDAVVFEGPHAAVPTLRSGVCEPPSGVRVVYRAQNCESSLWESKKALVRGAWRLLVGYQTACMHDFEKRLVQSCQGVAAVSEEDLTALMALADGEGSVRPIGEVVPVGYEGQAAPLARKAGCEQVMFLGRLDWYPNRDGLIWFLKEVWPRVQQLRPSLQVAIAGSGDYTPLKPYLSGAGIRFLGQVEDLEALYADSLATLVPVFYGGGTRVKVIEACWHGVPCVSTALGVQGVGLAAAESYFGAERVEDWVGLLTGLMVERSEAVGRAAYQAVREKFSALVAAKRFQSLIERIMVQGR